MVDVRGPLPSRRSWLDAGCHATDFWLQEADTLTCMQTYTNRLFSYGISITCCILVHYMCHLDIMFYHTVQYERERDIYIYMYIITYTFVQLLPSVILASSRMYMGKFKRIHS